MKIAKIFGLCCLAAVGCTGFTSCNEDIVEEQYQHYVGFKAPLDTEGNSVGVTTIYVPYTRHDENDKPLYEAEGISHYDLPVIVAGSTNIENALTVHIAPSDTLPILNMERFSASRKDIWYNDMSQFASYDPTVTVAAGTSKALLRIKFDFRNIDLADKYVLPLTIAETPDCGYQRNPLKNFATAMLRVLPYTMFSGTYNTQMKSHIINTSVADEEGAALNSIMTYCVGDDKVFFYAGSFNEDSQDRKKFKVFAQFIPYEQGGNRGTVVLSSENPDMHLQQVGTATYTILEVDDEVETYVMRRTVIINDLNYTFTDYVTAPGSSIDYQVSGTMTLERKFNTQMPEEDQIN